MILALESMHCFVNSYLFLFDMSSKIPAEEIKDKLARKSEHNTVAASQED